MCVSLELILATFEHKARSGSHNADAGIFMRICKLANLSPFTHVADLRQLQAHVLGPFRRQKILSNAAMLRTGRNKRKGVKDA